MDKKKLANVANHLLNLRRQEAPRHTEIHERVKDRIIDIFVPEKANREYRQLVEQSKFNILQPLINGLADKFFIDGYRTNQTRDNSPLWESFWLANRMTARQSGLFRPALEFGIGYASLLPGEIRGKKSAIAKMWSPLRMTAVYEDPAADEWPLYAMSVGYEYPDITAKGTELVTPLTIYDAHHTYTVHVPTLMAKTQVYGRRTANLPEVSVDTEKVKLEAHDLGFCPVVRFMDTWGELDEGPEGVVWSAITPQKRLNQTTYSLGMAEYYSAFRQKYVTGLAIQEDEDGNPVEPFNVSVDKLLQAESELTKFGEFGQTDLSGYLTSRDRTMLFVASSKRRPPHSMVVGDSVSNISAEALAALTAEHGQDIEAHKASFGESVGQFFRGAGVAMGEKDAANDYSSEARWRDTTPRSLAQIVDALGKAATMLEVPPEMLWERIPGVTDQDLAAWKKAHKARDAMSKLDGMVNGARSGSSSVDAPAPGANGGRRGGDPAGD